MQNQWFRDPARVRALLTRHDNDPERRYTFRQRLIARALFAGCKSGRNLIRTFGEGCNTIVWEEASPEIGSHSSACFPADLDHIRAILERERPDVVIGFGKIACEALRTFSCNLVEAPHPAARDANVLARLRDARQSLEHRLLLRS